MHFPNYIKVSLPTERGLFHKTETRALVDDSQGKDNVSSSVSFSKLEQWIRQRLVLPDETKKNTTVPLTVSYVDRDEDQVIISSTESLLLALRECEDDSFKVHVELASSRKNDQPLAAATATPTTTEMQSSQRQQDDSIIKKQMDQLTNDLAGLKTGVDSLEHEVVKRSDIKMILPRLETIETSLADVVALVAERQQPNTETCHDEHQAVSMSTKRLTLPLDAAFLSGDMCLLSSTPSRTCLQFRIGSKNSKAVWPLTLSAGRYRAVIDIADCQSVGGTFMVGLDTETDSSYASLQTVHLPYTMARPAYGRGTDRGGGNSKVVIPSLIVDEEETHFAITGSNSSFAVVSVTLESQL